MSRTKQRPSKRRDARLTKLAAIAVAEESAQREMACKQAQAARNSPPIWATQKANDEYTARLNALLEKKPNIFQRFAAWVDRVVKYFARL